MKSKVISLIVIVGAILLQSCSNVPEMNENNRKLLLGRWEVVKETMTNGDGFGGVVTRTENFLWNIDSYHFINDSQVCISSSNACYADLSLYPYPYTLTEQKDGTWLMTIPGVFDKERNLNGGLSPITIHKLSKNSMEWQYEEYGGDEGPVVYYQYLKKVTEVVID